MDSKQHSLEARGWIRWAVSLAGLWILLVTASAQTTPSYVVVDTGQDLCYDDSIEVTAPWPGQAFHGQDAQCTRNSPSYTLNDDGVAVYDNNTGLTWQRSADTDGDGSIDAGDKLTWAQAQSYPAALNARSFGGQTDWRLPTIKELYSLIEFRGIDPSGYNGTDTSVLVPYIDTDVFEFAYGDTNAGERIIDAQYASSTLYTGNGGDDLLFGVNFADGRIKGYGLTLFGSDKTFFVICCRGNSDYGVNSFVENGDGTITDGATGLMWQEADSVYPMTWEEALAYAENLELGGHSDWRLPDAKELQSIVDYTRSPDTTGSAAIDPLFGCTVITNEAGATDYPFYWSSTTHANWTATPGSAAAYVAFGRGLGYMNGSWVDVHGAGCQRSDPKSGDPADYPYGRGPQGDAIRIFNHVRAVRTAGSDPSDPPVVDPPPAEPPAIIDQPLSQAVDAGQPVTFEVTTGGTGPLSYQWQKDGAELAGANDVFYTIASATEGDEGTYSCIVSNEAGSVVSDGATLTVNEVVRRPPPRRRPRPPRPRLGQRSSGRTSSGLPGGRRR